MACFGRRDMPMEGMGMYMYMRLAKLIVIFSTDHILD